jgi:hypothetical protein
MSMAMVQCVREHSRADGSVRTLLLDLAIYHNDQRGYAMPSLITLSRDLHTDRTNVGRCVQKAVAIGELRVERGGGRGILTHYFVLCGNSSAHGTVSMTQTVAETVAETVAYRYENSSAQDEPSGKGRKGEIGKRAHARDADAEQR